MNKRQKLLGDRPNASLVEILLIPKHDPNWLESERRKKETSVTDGCTFRPQTLVYEGAGQRPVSHGDRNSDLYNMKSKGWVKDKVFKTS